MQFLTTAVDYFEGFLRFVFFGLMMFGAMKMMSASKADQRLLGLKQVAMGLLLWTLTSLLGDMASVVGDWTDVPYRFLGSELLLSLYFMLRQFISGFIDVCAGVMVMMGAGKVAKALLPNK